MSGIKYEKEVNNLAEVIEIAVDAFLKYPPKGWTEETIKRVIELHLNWKEDILSPKPEYKTITSLKQTYNDVFTLFQEGSGATVDYFWGKVKEHNLPYKRKNRITKILKRGKINNVEEYDFIKDILVPYKQDGLITNEEALSAEQMLTLYENKKAKF